MGDSAICAFLIAVTVLVNPGPAVTATAPIVPLRRAIASAAKTAETFFKIYLFQYDENPPIMLLEVNFFKTSCLVSTTLIPIFSAAARMGEM